MWSPTTIHASSGSYAEAYAKENNISFHPLTTTAQYTATPRAIPTSLATPNNHTYTHANATIDKEYLFVVVKDENAKDLLAPTNLLYIDQKTADETGSITFHYTSDSTDTYKELIFAGAPMEKGDLDGNRLIDLNNTRRVLMSVLRIITLSETQAISIHAIPFFIVQ